MVELKIGNLEIFLRELEKTNVPEHIGHPKENQYWCLHYFYAEGSLLVFYCCVTHHPKNQRCKTMEIIIIVIIILTLHSCSWLTPVAQFSMGYLMQLLSNWRLSHSQNISWGFSWIAHRWLLQVSHVSSQHSSGFHEWASQKERGRQKLTCFYDLASEVMTHHFLCILVIRSKLLGTARIQGKEN